MVLVDTADNYWIFLASYHQNKMKRDRLMKKYGDAALVDRVMDKMFWQGQPKDQLIDSLGKPLDIGQKCSKQKLKKFGSITKLAKAAMR